MDSRHSRQSSSTPFRRQSHIKEIIKEVPVTLARLEKIQKGQHSKSQSNFHKKSKSSWATNVQKIIRKSQHSQISANQSCDNLRCTQRMKNLEETVNNLKKRLRKDQSQNNIKSKLQEIIDLTKRSERQDNDPLKCFQLKKGYQPQSIVNEYWKDIEQRRVVPRAVRKAVRQNRINILMKENMNTEQEVEQLEVAQKTLRRKVKPRNTDTAEAEYQDKLIDLLEEKKLRRKVVRTIDSEVVKKEDAIKIYGLVKGGYNIDPSDPEGSFISLSRFNQAREDFMSLSELYQEVKDNEKGRKTPSGYDRSFRSLVRLNEMNTRVSNPKMTRYMEMTQVVR